MAVNVNQCILQIQKGSPASQRGLSNTESMHAPLYAAAVADCRNPASFPVALNCGIGSSSLNELGNAFHRLHMVRRPTEQLYDLIVPASELQNLPD